MNLHTRFLTASALILLCLCLASGAASKVADKMRVLEQQVKQEDHADTNSSDTSRRSCTPIVRICSFERHYRSCLHAWHNPNDLTVESTFRNDVDTRGWDWIMEKVSGHNDRYTFRSVRHPDMYMHVGGGREDVRLWKNFPHDGSVWDVERTSVAAYDYDDQGYVFFEIEKIGLVPSIRHRKSYLNVNQDNKRVLVYDKFDEGSEWEFVDRGCY